MNDNTEALPPLPEREQFEAWAQNTFGPLQRDDRLDYLYTDVRAAWKAWQARAALAQRQQVPPLSEDEVRRLWDKACRTVTVQGGGNDVLVFAEYLQRALTAAPSAQAEPQEPLTEAQLNSVCLSYRHDFGLMDSEEQERMRWTAKEWLRAFRAHGIGKQEGK